MSEFSPKKFLKSATNRVLDMAGLRLSYRTSSKDYLSPVKTATTTFIMIAALGDIFASELVCFNYLQMIQKDIIYKSFKMPSC